MFTSIDKALIAAVMSIVYILSFFGVTVVVDEEQLRFIIAMITPILVWIMPNLPKKNKS